MQEFDRVPRKTFQLGAGVVLQDFGKHNIRHGYLVCQTLFRAVEGSAAEENGPSFLNGGDATGGETAAVAYGIDLIDYRAMRIAWAQEVTMQRVCMAVGVYCMSGGG